MYMMHHADGRSLSFWLWLERKFAHRQQGKCLGVQGPRRQMGREPHCFIIFSSLESILRLEWYYCHSENCFFPKIWIECHKYTVIRIWTPAGKRRRKGRGCCQKVWRSVVEGQFPTVVWPPCGPVKGFLRKSRGQRFLCSGYFQPWWISRWCWVGRQEVRGKRSRKRHCDNKWSVAGGDFSYAIWCVHIVCLLVLFIWDRVLLCFVAQAEVQ